MKIHLIGKTEVNLFARETLVGGHREDRMPGKAHGSNFQTRVIGDKPWGDMEILESGQELIEFAGRLCYESFDLPSEKTETNPDYVANIVSLGHESVLEHVSVTFYVEGVSRNLSHELIRHRHLSFSELSQRYVDMGDANIINPPLFREVDPERFPVVNKIADAESNMYKHNVREAEAAGYSRKAARQAARYFLPAAMETKFVVSGNLRAWRDVLKKRYSRHADAEMQLFASEIFDVLYDEYPDVFSDIEYDE